MDNTEVLIIQCYKDANSKIKSLLKLYKQRKRGVRARRGIAGPVFTPLSRNFFWTRFEMYQYFALINKYLRQIVQ